MYFKNIMMTTSNVILTFTNHIDHRPSRAANLLLSVMIWQHEVFTVGVHVIPWHLRWGQALSEGVHVIVLLLQCCESQLLLRRQLNAGVSGPQVLQLRCQTATRGRCGANESHKTSRSLVSVYVLVFESFCSLSYLDVVQILNLDLSL